MKPRVTIKMCLHIFHPLINIYIYIYIYIYMHIYIIYIYIFFMLLYFYIYVCWCICIYILLTYILYICSVCEFAGVWEKNIITTDFTIPSFTFLQSSGKLNIPIIHGMQIYKYWRIKGSSRALSIGWKTV